MTITQTPDLSSVPTYLDGFGMTHLDPECPEFDRQTGVQTYGFGRGFPCSCADDLLLSAFGTGSGVSARLAGNVPGSVIPTPPSGDGTGSGRSTSREPSERQVSYLESLVAKKIEPEAREAFMAGLRRVWTSRTVSAAIDSLLDMRDVASSTPAVRPNRYAAECRLCHGTVPAGEGSLLKVGNAWVVEHVGGCPEAKTSPAHEATASTAPASSLPDVPAGHYAYPSSGSNDLAFVRVDRPTEGRWAGRTFVKWVVGGHPDMNVRRDQVASVLASIVAFGIDEAGAKYGQEIGRCCRCNRHLTDETSRALGIGPDCRSRS